MSVGAVDPYAIVFSLTDGYVWASWPGTEVSLRLGKNDTVSAMMRDYLAHEGLAGRLHRLASV